MRVALFGSSFDPPTGLQGHFGIITYLSSTFDEVWLLPVFTHPFASKKSLSPFEDRLAMLRLQCRGLLNVRVLEIERELYEERVGRLGPERAAFGTMDVLRTMDTQEELWLVLGEDTFGDLVAGRWRESEELLTTTRILVIKRMGRGGGKWDGTRGKRVEVVEEVPGLGPVSSTMARIAAKELDYETLKEIVGREVAEYIQRTGLYQSKL